MNELAAQMTIEQLGCSIDDIEKAKKLIDAYEKNVQRVKNDARLKRKQVEYRAWLDHEKELHPDRCYCPEEGVGVERKWEGDGIVEYVTTYSYYDYQKQNPYQDPVYRCSNCGKKYRQIVGIA